MNYILEEAIKLGADGVDFVPVYSDKILSSLILRSYTKEELKKNQAFPKSNRIYWKMVDGRKVYLNEEHETRKARKCVETIKIYSMVYDNPERGNNGFGEFLGEFRKVKQIQEDVYVDDFIGVNIATGEVCMILSEEVCGLGGGIKYEVIPIPELMERA